MCFLESGQPYFKNTKKDFLIKKPNVLETIGQGDWLTTESSLQELSARADGA